MPFDILVENFIDYLRFERLLSANTIKSYRRDLLKYTGYLVLNKIDDVEKISRQEIIYFMEHLFKSQTDTSVSRILSAIRSFYRYLIISNYIKTSPFTSISSPKTPKREISVLEQKEVSDFLDRLPSSTSFQLRDRAMF